MRYRGSWLNPLDAINLPNTRKLFNFISSHSPEGHQEVPYQTPEYKFMFEPFLMSACLEKCYTTCSDYGMHEEATQQIVSGLSFTRHSSCSQRNSSSSTISLLLAHRITLYEVGQDSPDLVKIFPILQLVSRRWTTDWVHFS